MVSGAALGTICWERNCSHCPGLLRRAFCAQKGCLGRQGGPLLGLAAVVSLRFLFVSGANMWSLRRVVGLPVSAIAYSS